jgi:hypothetical protein
VKNEACLKSGVYGLTGPVLSFVPEGTLWLLR